MIIPKARFLRQSYLKNISQSQNLAQRESFQITNDIVSALRQTETHKLGSFVYAGLKEKYPLLSSGAFEEYLTEIKNRFEDAGYKVEYAFANNGLSFHIDWRSEEISDKSESLPSPQP